MAFCCENLPIAMGFLEKNWFYQSATKINTVQTLSVAMTPVTRNSQHFSPSSTAPPKMQILEVLLKDDWVVPHQTRGSCLEIDIWRHAKNGVKVTWYPGIHLFCCFQSNPSAGSDRFSATKTPPTVTESVGARLQPRRQPWIIQSPVWFTACCSLRVSAFPGHFLLMDINGSSWAVPSKETSGNGKNWMIRETNVRCESPVIPSAALAMTSQVRQRATARWATNLPNFLREVTT